MIEIDFNPPDRQLRQFGFISLVGFPAVGVFLTIWPVGKLPIEALYVGIGLGVLMGLLAVANLTALIRPV